MMVSSLIISLFIVGAQDITITTNAGTEVHGQWLGIKDKSIQIEGKAAVPLSDLLVLRTGLHAPVRSEPPPQVMLNDGTLLTVNDISMTTDTGMKLKISGIVEPTTVKLQSVRWVRFGGGVAAVEQWQRLTDGDSPSDMLVVRRPSGSLDQVSGIVQSIEAKTVRFDMDGQSIEAPRTRLEGLILKSSEKKPKAGFEVVDIFGNVWRSKTILGTAPNTIELESPTGIVALLRLDQIERLSAEGNVVYLAEQPAVSRTYSPEFDLGLAKTLVDTWLASGAQGNRDVLLTGPGRLEYRVPEGFQRLRTVVSPDIEIGAGGGCELVVTADGKELWRGKFLPLDGGRNLAIDLGGGRRLGFEVLSAAGGSSGDRLILQEALLLP